MDEVLAAAGAGKGQLYHYFRGRDELVGGGGGYRCTQVLTGLTQALGEVSSLGELEQALAGFVAGFEQTGLPGCPIGSLATEVAGRNEGARLQAAAAFDAWERLFADALERMRERGELRADASPAVAGHGAAGQHRGRDGAEPDAQGPGVAAYRGGGGARAGTSIPGLTLY